MWCFWYRKSISCIYIYIYIYTMFWCNLVELCRYKTLSQFCVQYNVYIYIHIYIYMYIYIYILVIYLCTPFVDGLLQGQFMTWKRSCNKNEHFQQAPSERQTNNLQHQLPIEGEPNFASIFYVLNAAPGQGASLYRWVCVQTWQGLDSLSPKETLWEGHLRTFGIPYVYIYICIYIYVYIYTCYIYIYIIHVYIYV